MKKLLFLFPFFVSCIASAQIKDTTEALALAKRCKNFDETKADSLLIYSQQIGSFSQKNNFKQGISDAIRFKGMHYEYAGKYDTAIQYYLQNLEYAQKNLPPQKATALYSDLVAVYKITKQFDKAKDYGLQMLYASEKINDTLRAVRGRERLRNAVSDGGWRQSQTDGWRRRGGPRRVTQ